MKMRDLIKRVALWSKAGQKAYDLYKHYRVDCYVMSYPKCGRTWLRVMLAKALALHLGDPRSTVYEPMDVVRACRQGAPRISFLHGYYNHVAYPPSPKIERSEKRFKWYKHKKIVFLARDPRDVVVSYFFHRTRRMNEDHSLEDFVQHPWWGVDRAITFMREWHEHRHIPSDYLLIRYEDLHRDSAFELSRILAFLGLDVSDEIVKASADYASFDNMLRMSLDTKSASLAPADRKDPESFKVRKGQVGEYVKYLSTSDVEYIDERIRCELPSDFGYADSGRQVDRDRVSGAGSRTAV